MAGQKRREEPPLPPPRHSIVIDGANVIATSKVHPIERLDLVAAWCREWRSDLPVHVFIDSTTARRCRPDAQDVLRARCMDVTEGRPRYAVCPRGEPADEFVLQHAQQHQGLVVSNDRYMDYDDLRKDVVLVQFELAGERLVVRDEAVWFRPPNGAVWVPMPALRELGRTGQTPESV